MKMMRKLQALHSGNYEDKEDDEDVEFISCTVCGDRVTSEQIATSPCSHKCCHDCIAGLFNACIAGPFNACITGEQEAFPI
jgi:hypothetical protein